MANYELTNRIDMVKGQVLAAGSLEGSKRLMDVLLRSWTPHAALALTQNLELWKNSIAENFGLSLRKIGKTLDDPESQLDEIENQSFHLDEIYEESWFNHRPILSEFASNVFGSGIAFSIGPDYVSKIGENAPTPDFMMSHSNAQYVDAYYLSAFDIAVEFEQTLKDIDLYKGLYLQRKVKEFWQINFSLKRFRIFHNKENRWVEAKLESTSKYESKAIKGLTVDLDNLWKYAWNKRLPILTFHGKSKPKPKAIEGVGWGDKQFSLNIGRKSEPISFEEFIAWAPESKFETMDGKLIIGSDIGSRNVLGMLCQTLGIDQIVGLLRYDDWLVALKARHEQLMMQDFLRKHLLREARKAKSILSTQHGIEEVTVFGNWLRHPTINFWTEIKLCIPNETQYDYYQVWQNLRNSCDEKMSVVKPTQMTKADREEFEEFNLVL